MSESSNQPPVESSRLASTTADDGASGSAAALLDELLIHSIKLRDLYKSARWQTTDIQFRDLRILFDDHYKQQLRLVDVLIDRLRMLGGEARVLVGLLLKDTQFSYALREKVSPIRLLHALSEAHDAVLSAARSDAHTAELDSAASSGDFAVHQVVRVNNTQFQTISDQLISRSDQRRVIAVR
ncbi:MAG: ferritin-like domain-containing protein [Steroidobacteraceae bacterium]